MLISRFKRNSSIKKFVSCLVMLLVLLNFQFYLNPRSVRADNGTTSTPAAQLEIKVGYTGGTYTSVHTFQRSDLEALPQVQQAYSFIDNMPSPVIDSAVGVKLTDILTASGINVDNVKTFGFWTTDVPGRAYETLTKTYLLDTKRYYFPHLADNWNSDNDQGQISFPDPSAAAADAVEVPTILAIYDNWLREQNGSLQPDFTTQDDTSRFRLLFGKTNDLSAAVPEHTASKSARWVYQINVTLNGTAVTGVTLNKTTASLTVGTTDQLAATVGPIGATNQNVTWASDNPAAATVDQTGLVTAVAAGSTNIRVTTADGGKTATCAVTVNPVQTVFTPALTADSSENIVGQDVTLNFTDNSVWRAAISGITVDGTALDSANYDTTIAGAITIDQSVFATAMDYAIVVKASGYNDATVTQAMTNPPTSEYPVYTLTPVTDTAYTNGATSDGIKTMTVNSGMNGLKYFAVSIAPVKANEGQETVVFVHLRDGLQLKLNAMKADFDSIKNVMAGFNVQVGDVIKAYIVDELSNAFDFNPTILQ